MDDHDAPAGTSTITTRLLLRVAAERGGDEAVTRVLDAAGLAAQRRQLQSLRGRVSYPVKLRLFEAAVRELADPRIGLALGGAALADPALATLRCIAGALGSPAAALRHVSRLSTRLDSAAVFRSVACGDRRADLIRAAQEAMRRRERNTIDGGAVIAALVEMGMSYRDIERATGIPHVTAHRWAAPPRTVDQTDS